MQFISPNNGTAPVKIGKEEIPYRQDLERIVEFVVGDLARQPVLLGPALAQFGLSPDTNLSRCSAFLSQLLCFPRRLADRTPASEAFARERIDMAEVLMRHWAERSHQMRRSLITTEVRLAASWSAHYLERLSSAADERRLQFLRDRFGATAQLVRDALQLVRPSQLAESSMPYAMKAKAAILPPVEAVEAWKELLDQGTSTVAPLHQSADSTAERLLIEQRRAFYESVCRAIAEVRTPLAEGQEFFAIRELFMAKPGEVAKELADLIRTSSSFCHAHFSRVLLDRNGRREVVDIGSLDPERGGFFIIEIPTRLSFVTGAFGAILVKSVLSKMTVQFEGLSPRQFLLFDSPQPSRSFRQLERFDVASQSGA